jgi:hypothetical protein
MERRGLGRSCVFSLAFVSLLVGCGQSGGSASLRTAAGNYHTIRALETYYLDYQEKHKGQPPKDEQAFREFLATKEASLAKDGLTVDKMFVSPRNGEPLAWVYGKALPVGPQGKSYIAWEAKPSDDGKRFVLAAGGMYEIMDEAKFHAAVPSAQ